MDNMLKIFSNEGMGQVVSGRELHNVLGSKQQYTDWFKNMVKYGFTENVDFTVIHRVMKDVTAFGGKRKVTDYAMTLNMAKEIAMVQNNKIGKKVRQYLIEVEKRYRNEMTANELISKFNLPKNYSEALRALADTNDEKEHEHQLRIEAEDKLEVQKPKVYFYDDLVKSKATLTPTEIGANFGISAIVLNKVLVALGIQRRLKDINTKYVLRSDFNKYGIGSSVFIQANGNTRYQLRWTIYGFSFIYWVLVHHVGLNPVLSVLNKETGRNELVDKVIDSNADMVQRDKLLWTWKPTKEELARARKELDENIKRQNVR